MIDIGQLAKRANTSSRTLRYYEQIGLLKPCGRNARGRRLYGPEEVDRLENIRTLQQSGLSLRDIQQLLQESAMDSRRVVEATVARLDEKIASLRKLRTRFQMLLGLLQSGDDLLRFLQEQKMLQQHLTPEQWEKLQKVHERLGPERAQAAMQEWGKLLAAQDAAGARQLMDEFTDGDRELQKSLLSAASVFFAHHGLEMPPATFMESLGAPGPSPGFS